MVFGSVSGHNNPKKTISDLEIRWFFKGKLPDGRSSGDADLLPVPEIGRGLDDINETWLGAELHSQFAIGFTGNFSNRGFRPNRWGAAVIA
jgi:hypothetical protein